MCKCEEAIGHQTPCYINCKECGEIIKYSKRMVYSTGLKRNKTPGVCSSCLKIGSKNPFYNRKHTKVSMDKMIETSKNSEKRSEYYEKIRSIEHRQILSEWMKKNSPMRNNSFYKIWVEKYGKEIADEKLLEYKKKQSENNRGEKCYWFGKTPPFGSGNGWSGWYKGWYFRSLIELSYVINVIEKYNLNWKTGESKEYKITFEHKGKTKNYFPDFIINDKYMVECKPRKLWFTEIVSKKKIEAEKFCERRGLIYKLRDVKKLTDDEIFNLYESGEIVWIERYKEKFLDRIKKQKSNKIVEPVNSQIND